MTMDVTLFNDPLVLYSYLRDSEDKDAMCENFVSDYLAPLRNRDDAFRAGFFTARFYRCATPSYRDGSLIMSSYKHRVITMRRSVMKNSALVTAHGRYGIRGLALEWDTAVWGILRSIPIPPSSNPLLNKSVRGFRIFLSQARFLPNVSRVAKRLCLAMATAQHVVWSLLNYKCCGTITHFLRQMCSLTVDIYDKLYDTLALFQDDDTKIAIQQFFINRLCEGAGLDYHGHRHAVFFKLEFRRAAERALALMYRQLCGCEECGGTTAASNAGPDSEQRPNVHAWPRLESVAISLSNYPDLGRFHLPALRHLKAAEQTRLRDAVSRDLGFSLWNHNGFEPRFLLPQELRGTTDKSYVLFLVSNIVFNLKIIWILRQIVQREFADAVQFLAFDRDILIGYLHRRHALFQEGLVQSEAHRQLVADCQRYLADLRDIDFANFERRTFVESLCAFMDLAEQIPDYRQLSLIDKQRQFLLHNFRIRCLYETPSPETRLGESLCWYYLKRGDVPLGKEALLKINTRLSDAELCNDANRCRRRTWLDLPIVTVLPVKRHMQMARYTNVYVRRFQHGEVGGGV
ncbi:protein UL27 [Aotine betaherpesvirus 1]|uniref:Protein UL27 n=1 Tax=Aotine betaherpesvirus 1 TaxID=50290 RepID=G8XUA2_9BETA|nr:protein UL27 [Aotine betaherpesvirus 1]AEV80733.1 protein UL27 [Aotine betaherpesvirus 1]